MEDAIPVKAWRPFLYRWTEYSSHKIHKLQYLKMSINNKLIFVGIVVLGTSVRRVRVRAHKRVRNGKTESVKAHWRHVWR